MQSLSHEDKRALAEEASFFQLGDLSRLLEEPAQPKNIREDAQLFREVTYYPCVGQLGGNANSGREANAEFAAALSSQNWEVLAYATQKDNS